MIIYVCIYIYTHVCIYIYVDLHIPSLIPDVSVPQHRSDGSDRAWHMFDLAEAADAPAKSVLCAEENGAR